MSVRSACLQMRGSPYTDIKLELAKEAASHPKRTTPVLVDYFRLLVTPIELTIGLLKNGPLAES